MKKKLAIFDLDGTLVDTCRANYEAYKRATEKIGKKWDIGYDDFYSKFFGKNYKLFLPIITGADEKECHIIHDLKAKEYRDCVVLYGRVNQSLLDIIEGIREEYNIALITTASRRNVTTVIDLLLKQTSFDLIISAEDVTKLKPDIEAWVKAIDYFSVDVSNTIVFDDQDECIDGAVKKGIIGYKIAFTGCN